MNNRATQEIESTILKILTKISQEPCLNKRSNLNLLLKGSIACWEDIRQEKIGDNVRMYNDMLKALSTIEEV